MPKNVAPLVSWRGEHARMPLPLRVFGRYFITGQALRGPGDNATFLHRATIDYRARPYLTLTGPIWQRLARRHAAFTVPVALAAAAPWHGWWPLALYEISLTAAAGGWTVRRTYNHLKTRRRNRQWIDPAARLLCSILGLRYTRRAGRDMIHLPDGWGEDRDGEARLTAQILLPGHVALTKTLRANLVDNLAGRLGIPKPAQAEWTEGGPTIILSLAAAPMPPKEVTWASIAKAAREAGEEVMVAGRCAGGRLAAVNLAEDSPHVGISGPSGTGKSVLARVLLAPRVAWYGDGLLITDPKKFSHWRWAGDGKVDRNRIRYAWRTEDLHQAWVEVGEEIARRIELPEEELAHQRRVFLLVEEANVQTKKLIRYWRGLRKQIIAEAKLKLADDPYADIDLADLDPPVQSPAVVAMQEAVCMGRELKMHVIVAAQRMSASVFGGNGGDIRESFQGGRFLAKWDRKIWKMLVDTIDYVAWPGGSRGVWGLAKEGLDILRVPHLSEQEALAMVTGHGVAVHGPVLGRQDGHGQIDGHGRMATDEIDGHGQMAITSAVTLATALDMLPGQDGPMAITLDGLRTAARRGVRFPAPLEKPDGRPYAATEPRLYDLGALVEWREAAMRDS